VHSRDVVHASWHQLVIHCIRASYNATFPVTVSDPNDNDILSGQFAYQLSTDTMRACRCGSKA
jgi:hypothetical protein